MTSRALVGLLRTGAALAAIWMASGCGQTHEAKDPPLAHSAAPAVAVAPARPTAALPGDPDDPAIWINHRDPAKSLIVGTLKMAAPDGGLAVFGLDGTLHQLLKGANRPNNVDVEYGIDLDGTPTDIAVLTERIGRRLRVYAIAPDGSELRDISSATMPILAGASGDEGAPMGIGLYRRPSDGVIFAIVSPKAGPNQNYLWQYRLEDDSTGRVQATFVRRFGNRRGTGEIEAVAVDDALGYVYYAEEAVGLHKWHADPDAGGADRELAIFATDGYLQDREGIGIYASTPTTGFIVSVDQLPGESVFHLYRREGESGNPQSHPEIGRFRGPADSTDGLDVTSDSLGELFPRGLMVAMNSRARNFLLFDWRAIAGALPGIQ